MNFSYAKTRDWLIEHKACDACLGRQFHSLFKGDNARIGLAVRAAKNEKDALRKTVLRTSKKPKLSEDCPFCKGLFLKTDEAAGKALELIQNFEFDSFLVGVTTPKELTVLEEQMWAEIGGAHCEPLKKDLKRRIGIAIEEKTKKKVDFKNPDITLLVDFTREPSKIHLELNPVFIYGDYSKLVTGIPQTHWFCRDCQGRGCGKCNFTGKMYKESVEELIAPPIMEATGGASEKFHGSGREDIDAKMLGHRPFVMEIARPVKRELDFKELEEKINSSANGKIAVRNLRRSSNEEMRLLKTLKYDKSYEITLECAKVDDKKLKEIEDAFTGKLIAQRTPERVAHRRADLVRKREVKFVKCEKLSATRFKALVKAESGTYIKELATGDNGRTKPSFADFVGECKVVELNVLEVHKREGIE